MPSVSHTQQVRAPVTVLWDQIQDLSLWAKDIPGYLSHQELSPDESVWTVQGDVGAMSRRVEFRVLVTERLEPRRISFTLTGLNENLQGSGSFEAHQDEETRPGQVTPAVAGAGPAQGSFLRRLFSAFVRRRFAKMFPAPASAVGRQPQLPAIGPASRDVTTFVCALELQAGGVMGPVVNTLIEPLLAPAAAHLAGNIALSVEAVADAR